MQAKLWMIFLGGLAGLMVALLCGIWWLYQVRPRVPNGPGVVASEARANLKVRASVPYWDQERAMQSVSANGDAIDQVIFFWYYLGAEGQIETYDYADAMLETVRSAKSQGATVSALIANLPDEDGGDWDSKRVEEVIATRETRAAHIEDIVELTREMELDGITIDYEAVDVSQRDRFSEFIAELGRAMRVEGRFVGVALHPKTSRLNPDGLGGFQDWEALGQAADELYLMTFNEHWESSDPGPIASIGWIRKVWEFAKSRKLPKNKLYLGLALFGYDWHESEGAEGLTYEEVVEIQEQTGAEPIWDEEAGEHWFRYRSEGSEHQVWYSDVGSVRARVELANELGVAGVSLWRLGGEDPNVWGALGQAIR